jgi:hypothetical protein
MGGWVGGRMGVEREGKGGGRRERVRGKCEVWANGWADREGKGGVAGL